MSATSTNTEAVLLTANEQQQAARQLTLAMMALGLLALGLLWTFIAPAQTGVGQLLLGAAALMVALPVLKAGWYALRYPDLHGVLRLRTPLV